MAADNNDYQQFNTIKNDAIRRSNEMHRRSAAQQQNNNASQCSAKAEHSGCGNKSAKCCDESFKSEKNADDFKHSAAYSENLLSGINKSLGINLDGEKLVLIALIFLLAKEGADIKLIIALAYILL